MCFVKVWYPYWITVVHALCEKQAPHSFWSLDCTPKSMWTQTAAYAHAALHTTHVCLHTQDLFHINSEEIKMAAYLHQQQQQQQQQFLSLLYLADQENNSLANQTLKGMMCVKQHNCFSRLKKIYFHSLGDVSTPVTMDLLTRPLSKQNVKFGLSSSRACLQTKSGRCVDVHTDAWRNKSREFGLN